jgi:hypothetical protein
MEEADEYRMDAAAAMKLAESAANEKDKTLMLKVAEGLFDLAQLAEAGEAGPIDARSSRRNHDREATQQSGARFIIIASSSTSAFTLRRASASSSARRSVSDGHRHGDGTSVEAGATGNATVKARRNFVQKLTYDVGQGGRRPPSHPVFSPGPSRAVDPWTLAD